MKHSSHKFVKNLKWSRQHKQEVTEMSAADMLLLKASLQLKRQTASLLTKMNKSKNTSEISMIRKHVAFIKTRLKQLHHRHV